MARRQPLLLTAALGLAAALPACKDTSSFRLRWQIAEPSDPSDPTPELQVEDITRAYQCSQFGVTAVSVIAFDAAGVPASEDLYPCFSPGFEDPETEVDGPQLRAGEYLLVVRGVQRDLQEWASAKRIADAEAADDYDPDVVCLPDEDACPSWRLACDCARFTAVDDETFSDFEKFVLEAPDGCIDGIDNDADGLVDAEDPGCFGREAAAGDCGDELDNDGNGLVDILDPGCYAVGEDRDVSIVQFTLTASILDHNPAATCEGAGLTKFQITATEGNEDPFEVATVECRLDDPSFFSAELPAIGGELAISVTGLGANGAVTMPIPTKKTVEPGSNAIIDLEVDFAADTFDPPLVRPTSFLVTFAQHPDSTIVRNSCAADTKWGTLAIDKLSRGLLDRAGATVADATVAGTVLTAAPLDGTPVACDHSKLTSNALEWGDYRIVGEALAADGTVCFTTDEGERLAPSAAATLVLDRVLVDGVPPPSCIDCTTSDDCSGYECVDGVCR